MENLTPAQIKEIANKLLELPDQQTALECIDKMNISKIKREEILTEYNKLHDANRLADLSDLIEQTKRNAAEGQSHDARAQNSTVAHPIDTFNHSTHTAPNAYNTHFDRKPPSASATNSASLNNAMQTTTDANKNLLSAPPKKKKKTWIPVALGVAAVGIVALIAVNSSVSIPAAKSAPSATPSAAAVEESPSPTPVPKSHPSAQHTPANGATVGYNGSSTLEKIAPFEITTPKSPNDEYYYLLLYDHRTQNKVMGLFMHPGKTHEFLVPLGNYDVYVASGENWYGKDELFGEDGYYSKLDETFKFTIESGSNGEYASGWTLELQSSYNGNLDSTPVSYEDII